MLALKLSMTMTTMDTTMQPITILDTTMITIMGMGLNPMNMTTIMKVMIILDMIIHTDQRVPRRVPRRIAEEKWLGQCGVCCVRGL
jgi:hypothetical protein